MRIIVIILSVALTLISTFNVYVFLSLEDVKQFQHTNVLSATDNIEEELEKKHNMSEYVPYEKPLYVDYILVVNKNYGLPKDFKSEQVEESLEALDEMIKSAKEDGIGLVVRSGYRSYSNQVSLFKYYSNQDGSSKANTYSAKPGYSEHQTGLAYDFTRKNVNKSIGSWFNDTKEAKWLYENAHKFGFILRYPEGKEDITGYIYESWHYRYIGKEHSKNFNMNNLTLEEYLGLGN